MRRIRALIGVALIALSQAGIASAEVRIQDITSPGGISAWLVEEPSIPFVALELRFKGGTSLDAPGKRGATYLMSGLLEEGSGDLDAQAYARKLESLAASIDYDIYSDSLAISARFLTENRDQAVDLLHETLMEPRFDPDALERVRAQVLSGLRSDAKDPSKISAQVFYDTAFRDHPYATDGKGTIESVASLTRDDMFDAHSAILARDRLYVSAVGDITAEELGLLLDALLGDLPETGLPLPARAEVAVPSGITIVDFKTPQSTVMFGHEGIDRDDDDFFAAYVMNQILGGGSFESRLMTEVREKRGLTYGVYSYLVPRDWAALYLGSVASSNDRVAEAIEVIRDEWRKLATDGVTSEELDAAKTYLTGAYPLRFDGNGPIASIMVGMQMQGLPIDYIATRNENVDAVTLEDIRRVADRILDADALHFVVVGTPVGLESTTTN